MLTKLGATPDVKTFYYLSPEKEIIQSALFKLSAKGNELKQAESIATCSMILKLDPKSNAGVRA